MIWNGYLRIFCRIRLNQRIQIDNLIINKVMLNINVNVNLNLNRDNHINLWSSILKITYQSHISNNKFI